MLNLLTEEYKKEVLWEYRKRLIAICCFLVTLAILIGCVVLIPTYLNILQKRNSLETDKKILQAKIDLVGEDGIVEKVQGLTRDTDALQPLQNIDISMVMNRVIGHAEEVQLDHFSFLLNSDQTYTVDLSGISPNRDALLNFSKTLKADPALVYDEKSLPLSSFTKTKNINFSLKMGVLSDKLKEENN